MDILFTLRHLIKAGHRNGHGVHSPNIFQFYEQAIFSKEEFDYSNAEESLKLSRCMAGYLFRGKADTEPAERPSGL